MHDFLQGPHIPSYYALQAFNGKGRLGNSINNYQVKGGTMKLMDFNTIHKKIYNFFILLFTL